MTGGPSKSILHPTDFSFASLDAFAHALRIAVALRAHFHVLHIEGDEEAAEDEWGQFPQIRETLARWGMISPDLSLPDAADKLGMKFVKATVESDTRAHGVSAYAERHLCDLMVLMTHTRTGLERWLDESVAEEAARESHMPTLFLREDHAGFVDRETGALSLNTVLMPVEAQVAPLPAFRQVADLVHTLNPAADVMLLHVGEDLPIFEGLLPHIELRQGPVIETIMSYAQEIKADMIAMPTRGRRGLIDALRGSTTERALHETPVPLMAVPVK